MKKLKFLIIILPLFLLTGCWNYNELNELALITGISVDKDENGFIINYMISNATKGDSKSNSNQASTVLYEGKGNTITKATEDINKKLPMIPYLSHTEVIVISDKVAQDDMLNSMDFFLRNPESRKEIFVLISKDVKAKDTLSILTPLQSFPSDNIKSNIIAASFEVATTSTTKYSEFLSKLLQKGIEPTLGIIEVEGNVDDGQKEESNDQAKQDAVIKLTSTAVFKKDKLVYMSTDEESSAINILNKQLNTLYIETQCENSEIVSFIDSIDIKIDVEINNNTPKVTINLKGEGALYEVNCKLKLEDSKVIKKIQEDVEKEVTKLLQKGIDVSKNYKTDIFGYGNIIYKKNPNYFKNVEEKWNDEILPNLDIEIKANINLYSKGSLEQTIKEDLE